MTSKVRRSHNHGVIPNIAENKRNRKRAKQGRKRLFNLEVYRHRFAMVNLRQALAQ